MNRTDGSYLSQLQTRCRRASKKEKSLILEEFVKTTGYHRKHATAVLNGRRERVRGLHRRYPASSQARSRPSTRSTNSGTLSR